MTVPKVQVIPGWERRFLLSIKNGYNEKTAANAAGVGTALIKRQYDKNPSFKQRYDAAHERRRARPAGGLY